LRYLVLAILTSVVGAAGWLAAAEPAGAAQSSNIPVIEARAGEDFHALVLPYLQKLPDSGQAEVSPDDVVKPEWAERFVSPRLPIYAIINDHTEWFRFVVRNSTTQDLDLVLYNHFFSFILDVVIQARDVKKVHLGYGTEARQGLGWLFPAVPLTLVPGDTTVYVGVNTGKYPGTMNFELRPLSTFDTYHRRYDATATAFLVFGVAFVIFSAILATMLRSLSLTYYLISVGALLTLQSIIAGAPALFGWEMFVADNHIWMYSVTMATSFSSAFLLLYFGVSRDRHPWLYRIQVGYSLTLLTAAAFFEVIWRYELAFVALGVSVFSGIMARIMTLAWTEQRNRVRLIMIASVPAVASGAVQLSSFVGEIDSKTAHLAFWMSSILTFLYFVMANAAEIVRIDRHSRTLAASLHSVFPPFQVTRVVKEHLTIDDAPRIARVTTMFVDVVGYSLAARGRDPMVTFGMLKDLMSFIGGMVHQYNGIIDKSLGDGCLCFFGYDISGREVPGHEEAAVTCALDIQRQMIEMINARPQGERDIYPLRIGINTAAVCIGNMGDQTRFDFALHGDGVNLAKRLESASEPFMVTVSTSTYEAVSAQRRQGWHAHIRLLAIKHASPLIQAYEINPTHDPKAVDTARNRYWEAIGVRRLEQRFAAEWDGFAVETDHGIMNLQNFSHGGFCFKSRVFLGRGVDFCIDLAPYFSTHAVRYLASVNVQVRWGVPDGDGMFILGTMIVGLNQMHRQLIFSELSEQLDAKLRQNG